MPDVWDLRPPQFHTAPAYEHTFGPEVASVCEQAGFPPDPEQRLLLDDAFAVTDDGSNVAFEVGAIATRQQLKTGFMKQYAIGRLFVTQEELVTWSAHLFSTTEEAFRDLSGLVTASPLLRKRLAAGPTNGIHGARGSEHIELRDGRRLVFRSRTKTGGRGLTGDTIILDEAFALQPEHLGSLIPTLTAVPDPQIVYGSSAGLSTSVTLRGIRDRGRAGAPGLAYAEWGAPKKHCEQDGCEHHPPANPLWVPGCALDDEELWAVASPLLGRQRANGTGLTLKKLRKFRDAEPPEEWMRERLGWWDEPGVVEVFGAGNWADCVAEAPAELKLGALALGVEFDLSRAAIGGAAVADNRVVVKPLTSGFGVNWVVEELQRVQRLHKVPVVYDVGGPAAGLADAMRAAGIRTYAAKSKEMNDAFDVFFELVKSHRLLHENTAALNDAVNGAVPRFTVDRRKWGRRTSTSKISILEAVHLAAWHASRPKRRVPLPPPPKTTSGGTRQHELMTQGF